MLRRVPTALDTAYAVLGNKEVGFKIAERMLAPRVEGDFQNGFPYAHNLTALAATFDRVESTAWRNSIYTRWLDALRALSEPTTGPAFPESMRSRAWAMKNLNTQLASYTELKHDTVLYAKQPYASIFLCEYPAGFIEPVPEFWKRMREMAEATAEAMSHYQIVGSMFYIDENVGLGKNIDFGERHRARVAHCSNFAQTMTILEEMALKELSQEPFTQDEEEFIRGLMNSQDHPYVGPSFDGWYPDLYYKDYALEVGSADENGSNKADFLTTDVFTAPPDEIDPVGGILQEATGPVDLLMIAVDNGLDKMVYAGPVMSHFEFVVPGPDLKRLTNDQWKAMHNSADRPARPEWTRSHLVPVSE